MGSIHFVTKPAKLLLTVRDQQWTPQDLQSQTMPSAPMIEDRQASLPPRWPRQHLEKWHMLVAHDGRIGDNRMSIKR
jgi:hypothetical protein